jgi:beta-galactosidase
MAAVRIRILDEFSNTVPYAQLPVKLAVDGVLELVGPDVVTAEGGMCGTYLRTVGRCGNATLTIATTQTPSVSIAFEVK